MPERRVAHRLIGIAALVTLLDQLSKAIIVASIGPQSARSSVPVAGDWLSLEYAENRGVAFGLLVGAGPLLIVVTIAVIVMLLRRSILSVASNPWEVTAVGIIVGGAIGNLLDRLRHGFVVDFVSVGAWPNFNLADSAITVGVAMLIWTWLIPGTIREHANLS